MATTDRAFSLDVIKIETPCTEDWSAMHGDDATRFCDKCQLHVHNLSAMTPEAAQRLMDERQGRLCVRVEHRETAKPQARRVRPRPYPRLPGAGVWSRVAAMLGMGLLGLWGMSATGCDQSVQGDVAPDPSCTAPGSATEIMGDVAEPNHVITMGAPAPTTQPATQPGFKMGEIAAVPTTQPDREAMMGGIRVPVMGVVPATQPAPAPEKPQGEMGVMMER